MAPTQVVVLGASGMLGSMVVDYLSRDPLLGVSATVRTEELATKGKERLPGVNWQIFDADVDPWNSLSIIGQHEWVINSIGITKPLVHDDVSVEVERAIRTNSLLPSLIAKRASESRSQVLQIATDCVYSGSQGNYKEDHDHDALDVYGKTKSLGEVREPHVHHLRCSIVGPEPKEHKFLLDWFLGQPKNAILSGYENHQWNGLTTLHFAKLCHGIITRGVSLSHMCHIIPRSPLNKCELLQCFASSFNRGDITIEPVDADIVVDRTLATIDYKLNQELWRAAGHPSIPSIPDMLAELSDYYYRFTPPLPPQA